MSGDTPAERILKELGITEPHEIDLEAIAWKLGARVRYRRLDGCEARIVGSADRAIITVNSRSSPRRQRFSIDHELGHWYYDRGRVLICLAHDIGQAAWGDLSPERVADRFASSLLMPDYIFRTIACAHPRPNFQTVQAIADEFDTSRIATAIRLVEGKYFVGLLVCHGLEGRKWFTRSPDVPSRWFPCKDLSADSFAFAVLFGHAPEDKFPRKIGADAWFDRREADRYEVYEQTIRTTDDEILSLILVSDDEMLRNHG